MARWVQLELLVNPSTGERDALACAFYHVCAVCGEQRAVLRWSEEGSRPTMAGAICPHLELELANSSQMGYLGNHRPLF